MGCPTGRLGLVWLGSSSVASSANDGSRQLFRPPTVLSAHSISAWNQTRILVDGDCSHTRPVSLSRTAAPPITQVNRLELLGHAPPGSFAGKVLSHACGSPRWSPTLPIAV